MNRIPNHPTRIKRYYRQWEGWICLGDFDFPAGEVSVTLSDYDELGRDFIAVIADAVKWEKLED